MYSCLHFCTPINPNCLPQGLHLTKFLSTELCGGRSKIWEQLEDFSPAVICSSALRLLFRPPFSWGFYLYCERISLLCCRYFVPYFENCERIFLIYDTLFFFCIYIPFFLIISRYPYSIERYFTDLNTLFLRYRYSIHIIFFCIYEPILQLWDDTLTDFLKANIARGYPHFVERSICLKKIYNITWAFLPLLIRERTYNIASIIITPLNHL